MPGHSLLFLIRRAKTELSDEFHAILQDDCLEEFSFTKVYPLQQLFFLETFIPFLCQSVAGLVFSIFLEASLESWHHLLRSFAGIRPQYL